LGASQAGRALGGFRPDGGSPDEGLRRALFRDETLPRFNAIEQLQRDTRALDRVLNTLGENPQSFARRRGSPPGESGVQERIR
jgi:hypothetical protein